MSLSEVQAALREEKTPHLEALIEVCRASRDGSVNAQKVRWCSSFDVPVEKTKLDKAYKETAEHPARAISKMALVMMSQFRRATIERNKSRLDHYACNRVRYDVTEAKLDGKNIVTDQLAK